MYRPIYILLLSLISVAGSMAQLDHFVVDAQGGGPISSQTAGVPLFIEVLAQDSTNNIDTAFQGKVKISSPGTMLNTILTPVFVKGILNSFSITFSNTGTFTATATNSAGTQTGTSNSFSVVPNSATVVDVETAPDGNGGIVPAQTVVSGNSVSMYAVTRDSFGNFIGNIAADSWSLQNKTGGVANSNLVSSGGRKSAVFTGALIESGSVSVNAATLPSTGSGTLTVTPGPASALTFIQQPSNTQAGSIISPSIKVEVTDQAGNVIHTSGIAISLASSNGILNGTTAQLTDANGTATFNNLFIDSSVTTTLTASSGILNSANSNSFTIFPGHPAQLVYVQEPVNTASGSTITPSVVVQVRDSLGNNVDTSGISITLSISSGTGILTGTLTRTTNTNGTATFDNLSINLAGSKQLTASSSVLISAVSNIFTISPGPLNTFLVTGTGNIPIGTQIAGTPFTLTIEAEDAAGNVVTSFNGTANISSSGNLSAGGGTTVPFVNGVLTPLPVTISNTGTFTMTATHTSGTETGTSNSFAVTPGAPATIRIETATNGTGTIVPVQSIVSGNSITVYSIVRDSLGNFISNIAADSWSLQNISGGIISGDLAPGVDNKSAVFTGHVTGSAQIHATSGSLLSINSNLITVRNGNATQFSFIQQPTNTVSGAVINPAISLQLKDASRNNVALPGVSSTASLIGSGTLGGTTTVLSDSNGVITFSNLNIDLAGSKQLLMTGTSLANDTSNSFTILPGFLQNFLVEANAGGSIPTQTAGTSFSIKITARDLHNNTVTGFTGTVDISSTGILSSGSGTTPNFSGGILSSQPVTILEGGTFTITATQTGGGPAGTSNSFVVNNTVPTTLNISPTTKTVGDAGFTVTVNGTNFISSSVVRINGTNRSTTFINNSQLTASILSSDISAAGTPAIAVFSPAPGGGISNIQTLTVGNPVVNIKVFLQGPFSGGSMTTTLRTGGFIPLTQPYHSAPWNYAGAENVASIPANVVDWILIELRTGTSSSTKIATRAAFIRSDGSVVDIDGVSPVSFSGITLGTYYIVVRHRNHLAIMSANPATINGASSLYDFTTSESQAFGTTPMATLSGGVFGMYAGDVNGNGTLKYSGSGNDSGPIYARIGGASVSATMNGYFSEDTNMNGIVKYSGAQNDRAIIYVNIGGGSVSTTISTQVPP